MNRIKQYLSVVFTFFLMVSALGGCAHNPGESALIESTAQSEEADYIESSGEAPFPSGSDPVSEAQSSESKTQTEDPYSWILQGRFRTGEESGNPIEAELSRSEDTLYLRLIANPDSDIRSVVCVCSLALSSLSQRSTIELTSEWQTNSITFSPDGSFDLLYDGEPEDYRSGTYNPFKTEPRSDPPSECFLDPDFTGGKMDAGLAAAARTALGMNHKSTLTAEDCAKIRSLNVFSEDQELVTFEGIEYFTNLQDLSVSDSCVSDLFPLQSLVNLEKIELNNGTIESLAGLENCKKLKTVILSCEPIQKLDTLAELPQLQDVTLINTQIKSIAPLRENHTIKSLSIENSCIADWESIAENESLKDALMYNYEEYLAIETRAKEILSETVTPEMSELEKEVRIAKAVENLIDYEFVNENEYINEDGTGHPLNYYPFFLGKGVCRDYADAAKYLMSLAGLEVRICSSFDHDWNIVLIDGEWYEFDCTWDDCLEPDCWIWFNRSRTGMLEPTEHHTLDVPQMYPHAALDMPYARYAQILAKE